MKNNHSQTNPSSARANPKISYPSLGKNLPQDKELRDYLTNKEESGKACHQIKSELIRIALNFNSCRLSPDENIF